MTSQLEKWLQGVRDCPDDCVDIPLRKDLPRLTAEFGIYDNFPILMQADYKKVLKHLMESSSSREFFRKGFKFLRQRQRSSELNNMFEYNPGVVDMQFMNTPACPIYDENNGLIHCDYQESGFNIGFMFHPYKKTADGSWLEELYEKERYVADAVTEICEYAIKRNLPLCMPRSRGWIVELDNEKDKDYSCLVYFPDGRRPPR